MIIFDLFVGTPSTREYYGKALKGVRNQIYLAGHLGCADQDWQYVKTRDEALCRKFLAEFYEKLDTDYINVLFLHNCDEETDLDNILNGWMYAYAKELKEAGRAGFIGISISYVLSFPQVACPVPGFSNVEELNQSLAYLTATEEEKDFSEISESLVGRFRNQCMYCNHCQPCPKNIDIAEVTKLADLAEEEMTDALRRRYAALKSAGKDCIRCGACTKRCPFGIDAASNMQRAFTLFSGNS